MSWFNQIDKLKRILLRNIAMAIAAYHVGLLISYLSVWLDISYYTSTPFNYLLMSVYLTNGILIWSAFARQHISKRFSNQILILLIFNWLLIFAFWCFFMVQLKVLTLICAMMGLSFLFAYSTIFYSLLLTVCISGIYLLTSFIGIEYYAHPLSMPKESLNVLTFLFISLLIGLMLHRLSYLLRNQASNDFLTKLLNRRAMSKHIQNEFQRNKRFSTNATLVMMDLDDFKIVNDTFGHDGGDAVLQHVAKTLKHELRDTDYLARWGGEEFLALLVGITPQQAIIPIQRVLDQLVKFPVEFLDREIKTSFSAGMVSLSSHENSALAIQEADRLLYIAKSKGKSCIISAE